MSKGLISGLVEAVEAGPWLALKGLLARVLGAAWWYKGTLPAAKEGEGFEGPGLEFGRVKYCDKVILTANVATVDKTHPPEGRIVYLDSL